MNPFHQSSETTDKPAAAQGLAARDAAGTTGALDSSLENAVDANTLENSNTTIGAIDASSDRPEVDPYVARAHANKRRQRLVRFGVLGVAVVVALVLVFTLHKGPTKPTVSSQVNEQYGAVSLPLGQISGGGLTNINSAGTVSINGQLNVNNALVLTPTKQPTNPIIGQLYFDQTTNKLSYYNGSSFATILSGGSTVAKIGTATGNVATGSGLHVNGNTISNSGVLTLQGQAGNVSLTSGGGIAINGTTLSNTGVLSVGGQHGNIGLGSGLQIVSGKLSNSGILSATAGQNITVTNDGHGGITISGSGGLSSSGGTAGKLAVFTGVQTIADSLISQSGSTITVSGNLNVTGSLTLGSPLSVSQGGTGVGSLPTDSVLIGNGTSGISGITGTSGDCLMADASGKPVFQACPGTSVTGTVTAGTITPDALTKFSGSSGEITSTGLTETGSTLSYAGNAVVNAASGFSGNLLDLQINGSSKLSVSQAGSLVVGGDITASNGTVTAQNFSGNGSGLTNLNGSAIASGTVANTYLTGSGALSVSAGNGLTGGGSVALGGSTGLSVQAASGGCITVASGGVSVTDSCVNAAELNGNSGSYYTNASNINAGTIGDSYLSNNVTLQGNTFNGVGELVQLDTTTGHLPALNGSALTNLNGSAIASGTVANTYLTGSGALNVTAGNGLAGGGSVALGGSTSLTVNAGSCITVSVAVAVTDNCVNAATLNGQAGSYYTNASNINAGTIGDSYLSGNVTLQGNTFNGVGELVQLDATTGYLPILNGSNLTNLNGSAIASGTVANTHLVGSGALSVTAGNGLAGGGSVALGSSTGLSVQAASGGCITVASDGVSVTDNCVNAAELNGNSGSYYTNASHINAGIIGDTYLSTNVTLQGNTFNGIGELVQLDATTGYLPILNGSALTNLNGSAIASGTVANTYLTGSGALNVGAGNGLTGGGSVALGGSTTLNVAYGSTTNTAVQGNTTLTCAAGTGNLSGGGDTITLGSGGSCSDISITSTPSFSSVTLGDSTTVAGQITLHDGSTANSAVLQLGGALSGNVNFTLPNGYTGTQTICTIESGNCAGSGSGVTASGTHTQNYVSKFSNSGGTELSNSSIYDNGTGVSIGGTSPVGLFNVGASNQFQVSGSGSVTAVGINSGSGLIQGTGGLSVGGTITFGGLTSSGGQCLTTDASGKLALVTCLSGAGGGSGGVASINGDSGTLTLNNATATDGSHITIDNAAADGSTKGIATFDANNFTDNGSGLISIAYGSTAGTSVEGNTTIDVTAGTGLTGGGTITLGSGGTATLNVSYGSTASTAAEGNTSLTFTGAGNLTGTVSGTAGGGFATNTLALVNNPTFTGLVTANGLNAGGGLIQGTGGLTVGGTVTLSSLTGGSSTCLTLDSSNHIGTATCATGSGSAPTFQDVYNNSSSSPLIALNTTGNGLVLQDASTPIGTSLFTVESNDGLTKYFNVTASGASVAGSFSATGTVKLSNLSTGAVLAGSDGTLSSGTINLGSSSYVSGTLGVANGGTGLNSLTSNELLYGSSSSAIGQITNGSAGQCLVANASGAPSFQTCTGAGGVSSINSQNGALTFNGTANEVSVTNTGSTFTFATPQAIGTSSNVTFGTINTATISGGTLSGGTVSGGTLTSSTVNGLSVGATSIQGNGSANLAITAAASGNHNLVLNGSGTGIVVVGSGTASPYTGNVATFTGTVSGTAGTDANDFTTYSQVQNLVASGVSGASGNYVQFASGTVQTNSGANSSIFINNTSTGKLIQLQASGTDKFVVDNTGLVTASNLLLAGGGYIDTSAGGALNIGKTSGGNATSINLNQNTTVAAGKTFTANGSGFDATGNLGIGTTAPSAKLDIQGGLPSSSAVNITSSGTATSAIEYSGNSLNINRSITANTTGSTGVQFDAAVTANASGNLTKSFTVGNHTNRFLLVEVARVDASVPTLTYAGTAVPQIGTIGNMYIYALANPTVGTNNLVATNTSGQRYNVGISSWYNVSQTNPYSNFTTTSGTGGTASLTLTTIAGQVVVDQFTQYDIGGLSVSPGSGQTTIYNTAAAYEYLESSYVLASSTSLTISESGTANGSHTWYYAALALNPATGGLGPAITGSLANLSSNCTLVGASGCTDTSNILNLNQQYTGATGAVLNIQNAGTGDMLDLANGSGTVVAKFDASGNLQTSGTITVGTTPGSTANIATFNGTVSGTEAQSNGQFTTLGQVNSLISSGVGGAAGNYIANGTSPQTANFNVQGAANSSPVAKIDVGSSTGDILQVGDGSLTGFVVTNAGFNNFYGDATFNGYASFAQGIDSTTGNTTLDIGQTSGGNATSISLNQDTTVASGKTLNVGGAASFTSYAAGSGFSAPANYTTGTGPNSVTEADFNDDGIPDLAVANFADNTVTVYFGTGSGTFTYSANYPVGNGPEQVIAVNFNGHQDLVTANYTDATVSVLMNVGNGTFSAKQDFAAGTNPFGLAAGDFNGDGKMDVAVVDSDAGNELSVLLNTTTPGVFSLAAPATYTTGSAPQAIVVTDLDGDGAPDLIIANHNSGNVEVYINNNDGSGTFKTGVPYTVGTGPNSLVAADFGTGKISLAVANANNNTLTILPGAGDGTFGAAITYTTASTPEGIVAGDFTNDGKTDLAVANQGANSISIFPGNGDNTFGTKVDYPMGASAKSLATGDFNGDGKPDLATALGSTNQMAVVINSATKVSTPAALSVLASSSSTAGIIIQGAAGQTTDLLGVQSSDGDLLFSIDSAGVIQGTSANFNGTVSGANAMADNQFVTLGQANGNYIQNSTTLQAGSNFNISGTGIASNLVANGAPAASTTSSVIQLGSAIQGGNGSGTYIGLNAASGYGGDLLNFQVGGVSKFKIDASGNLTNIKGITASGDVSISGNVGIGTTTPSYNLDVQGTAGALTLYQNGNEVCDTSGNCAGSGNGGGVTNAGHQYYLTKTDASGNLVDSQIYDDGTKISIGSTSPGYNLQVNGTIQGTTILQGSNTVCDTSGNCGYNGAGTGAGVASVNTLTGDLTLQGTSQIIIQNTDTSHIGFSIQADSIDDTQLKYDTGQNLTTSSTPTFAGINLGTASQFTVGNDGSVTTSGLLTANGGITIGSGKNFVNGGSTLNAAKALSLGASGAIGTAAATVDAYTTFNVTATATSLNFSLPSPTVTTAGRLAYISNVGTNSFTIGSVAINSGASASFIWNGTSWTSTAVSTGVSLVGGIDAQTASANGAVINGNSIYLQSASTTAPGLVNTAAQSFKGNKSFTNGITIGDASNGTASSIDFVQGGGSSALIHLESAGVNGLDATVYLPPIDGSTICVDTGNCDGSTGNGGYIVNSTSPQVGTANFNITGSGTVGKLSITGTPTASATTSLIKISSAIQGGSASGTYIGLNAPSSYIGDLVNLQVNGASEFKVDSTGEVDASSLFINSGQFSVNSGFGVSAYNLNILGTPDASATASLVNISNDDIQGGNANGTYLGLNAASGYTGDFLNFQNSGTSKFKIDSSGNLTAAGTVAATAFQGDKLDATNAGDLLTIGGGKAGTISLDASDIEIGGSGGTNNFNANWNNFYGSVTVSSTPTASATASLVQVSSTAIQGGNANGTYIGLNTASGYSGDLLNFQVNGASKFEVDASGNLNAGQITVSGGGFWTTISDTGIDYTDTGGTFTISGAAPVVLNSSSFGVASFGQDGLDVQNASNKIVLGVSSTGTITLGDSTSGNYATFTAGGGYTATGTARHIKTISLTAEYAGAVLDAASDTTGTTNCSTNNSGIMASGFDSSTRQNYYEWASSSTSTNCYDVVVQIPIPADFNGWAGTPTLYIANSSSSASAVCAEPLDTSGAIDSNASYGGSYDCLASTSSLSSVALPALQGTYSPSTNGSPKYMTLKLRLTSTSNTNITKIGNLALPYYSSF